MDSPSASAFVSAMGLLTETGSTMETPSTLNVSGVQSLRSSGLGRLNVALSVLPSTTVARRECSAW